MTSGKDLARLGQAVRGRRIELGLTQKQAALDAGLSDTTWLALETGKATSARTRRAAAQVLEWTPESPELILAGADPEPVKLVRNVAVIGGRELDLPLDTRHHVGDDVFMALAFDRSDPLVQEMLTVQARLAKVEADADMLRARLTEIVGELAERGDVIWLDAEVAGSVKRDLSAPAVDAAERASKAVARLVAADAGLPLAAAEGNVREPRARDERHKPLQADQGD
jgi:DNA-binding XRE family transcriptional regulator